MLDILTHVQFQVVKLIENWDQTILFYFFLFFSLFFFFL